MSAVPITPAGKKRILVKTTVLSYGLLIRHLLVYDAGVSQLLEITGLHRQTIGNILRAFHKLDIIHVCKWLPDGKGRHNIPVYRWGAGVSIKRPCQTPAQRQQKRRNKLRAQEENRRMQELAEIDAGLRRQHRAGYSAFTLAQSDSRSQEAAHRPSTGSDAVLQDCPSSQSSD